MDEKKEIKKTKEAIAVKRFVRKINKHMDEQISELEPYVKDGAFQLCKMFFVKEIVNEEYERMFHDDEDEEG